MRSRTHFSLISAFVLVSTAQDLPWREGVPSPQIEQLRQQVKAGDPRAVDRFWQEMKNRGTPLVESIPGDASHLLATFLYRAPAQTKSILVFNWLNATRDETRN